MRKRPRRRIKRKPKVKNGNANALNTKRLFRMSGLIIIILITIALFHSLQNVDELIMPAVFATYEMRIKNDINAVINTAIEGVMANWDLEAEDFFTSVTSEDGQITSINVNTVLVNSICGSVAAYISEHLSEIRADEVRVPAGALLGIEAFANVGPRVRIEIKPVGNVIVDYETTFASVGINQVNFQIWLVVNISVRIVNPPQDSEITLSRKVAIVNTVFSGQVPDNFIGFPMMDR